VTAPEPVKTGVVHWLRGRGLGMACGLLKPAEVRWSRKPEKVTCPECRREMRR
jgi:hypothetical protein